MEEAKTIPAEEPRKLNFLEEIIEDDLKSGKVDSVMTRFPPEPNGYLHLGHAKSICINFGLAQKYGGKTNLRFDDTNPTKEDTEYVDSIKEDIKWMGFQWESERYASDYFDQLYEWAEDLIRRGYAYVDDQTQEEISKGRGLHRQARNRKPFQKPQRRGKPSPVQGDEGWEICRRRKGSPRQDRHGFSEHDVQGSASLQNQARIPPPHR
jgi:Glutamyl- and glutaminyl-tRNA synthetases